MNQQILFNDDIVFDDKSNAWVFTGLLSGERVTISIRSANHLPLSDSLKFDFECQVEEWLEDNEPLENGEIALFHK